MRWEDSIKSPTMVLEETIGRLQRDLEELQSENENQFLKTPRAVTQLRHYSCYHIYRVML